MKKGDLVIFNGKCEIKEGEEFKIWTADSDPIALASGIVIRLKGRKGAYPVEGLNVIFPGGGVNGEEGK